VLDADGAARDLGAAEVVHRQHRAALVLVGKEGEAAAAARVLVAREVDVHDLAILRKHREHIALGQLKVQAPGEDVGRVLEARVPGGLVVVAQLDLLFRVLLRVLDLRERIHSACS
jgi:hypothetical protein